MKGRKMSICPAGMGVLRNTKIDGTDVVVCTPPHDIDPLLAMLIGWSIPLLIKWVYSCYRDRRRIRILNDPQFEEELYRKFHHKTALLDDCDFVDFYVEHQKTKLLGDDEFMDFVTGVLSQNLRRRLREIRVTQGYDALYTLMNYSRDRANMRHIFMNMLFLEHIHTSV